MGRTAQVFAAQGSTRRFPWPNFWAESPGPGAPKNRCFSASTVMLRNSFLHGPSWRQGRPEPHPAKTHRTHPCNMPQANIEVALRFLESCAGGVALQHSLFSGEVKFRFSLVRFCDFQACNFNILQIVSFPCFSLKLRGTIPRKMVRFHWARKMQNRNAEIRNFPVLPFLVSLEKGKENHQKTRIF